MSMYRKEWDCCGDVSETNGWEPEACPFCATPPSPSTAPEVPPFPESFGLADVPHAMNTPDDWDADYRATWQKLQVAEINLSQMRAYARKLRAALASRPAEADDEAARLRKVLVDVRQALQFANDSPNGGISDTLWMMHSPETVFDFIDAALAEQYRQGQRDAVAADRAKVPVSELLAEIQSAIDTLDQAELENRFYVPIVNTLHHCRDAFKGTGFYGGYRAAPSHTTNKEK